VNEPAPRPASPGEIAEGSPLKIRTMAGPVLSLDDMTVGDQENAQPSGPPPAKPQETKPKPKPGQKPPGGHTPGAPGGGRHG